MTWTGGPATARSRQTGGAGLGLAIVAEVIERHHGSIRITAGFTFEARLPSAAVER